MDTTQTHTGLIRICSWCHRLVDDNNKSFGSKLLAMFWGFTEGDKITHSICCSCHTIERKKLAQYRAEKGVANVKR